MCALAGQQLKMQTKYKFFHDKYIQQQAARPARRLRIGQPSIKKFRTNYKKIFITHKHTHTLSLSLSHTHTHTHTPTHSLTHSQQKAARPARQLCGDWPAHTSPCCASFLCTFHGFGSFPARKYPPPTAGEHTQKS